MSIRTVQTSAMAPRHTAVAAKPTANATAWVRNPSWRVLPSVSNTEEKFVGLHAVWPEANFLAFTVAGAFTVDWGDGITENFATGATAQHEYDYTNANLANTNAPVTFTASGSTVNRTAHGYSNGQMVSFASITTTTGISVGQTYFVVNATADTFQVASSSGGASLTLTNDGSGAILPYKQAIVIITMQAGQSFTSLNLNVRNTTANLQNYASGWLDIIVSGPNLTALTISATAQNVRHRYLEQAQLISDNAITSFAGVFHSCGELQSVPTFVIKTAGSVAANAMFQNCYSLQTVPMMNTSAVTTTQNMFNGCASLITVPLFDTRSVTNMAAMFLGCSSLQTVPLFNTALVQTMASMFSACASLQAVPLFNTQSVTSMNGMFSNCYSLQSVPLFNTLSVTDMAAMFQNCYSLQSVPLFNTSVVTAMGSMFQNCYSLQSVPLFNTPQVGDMATMFSGCQMLQSVPLLSTGSVTAMNSMFANCGSLKTVPQFNTQNVLNMSAMFSNCSSLQSVPLFNTVKVTDFSNMFVGCSSLQSVPVFNTGVATTMANMVQNCVSLKSFPLLNSANVTTTANMFSGCFELQSIPLLNMAANLNLSFMFYNCYALQAVPALNCAAASSSSNLSSIFSGCNNLASIQATGFKYTLSLASLKLSKARLEEVFANLGNTTTLQTLTITANYGVDTAVTRAGAMTSQSTTVPMTNTSGLSVGMFILGVGTGLSSRITVTSDVAADTLTLASHGLPNGTKVSFFTTLGTTTGVNLTTIYYVVNSTTNTFQIAETPGGSPINLTGSNSTMYVAYPNYILAIDPNVSITMDTPAASTVGSVSLTFRKLNAADPMLKNWSVTY